MRSCPRTTQEGRGKGPVRWHGEGGTRGSSWSWVSGLKTPDPQLGCVQLGPRGITPAFTWSQTRHVPGQDLWVLGQRVVLWGEVMSSDALPRTSPPQTKALWVMAVAPEQLGAGVCARVCAMRRCVPGGPADSQGS